ncbi:alpha/beta hydrolase [Neolewinella persica]|uniref:alpha/beta hydrolase n=1 Tax=Neolewinella persica TaxID=70998 RepID=UPI00037CD9B4|nr:alpha/beta hydrolase-fold protein [Neolewinella persica]
MPRFRTTELSDPRFETDNLRFLTVKTPNLKGRGDICVFVPVGVVAENLPLVILLHGVYGSCWCWAMKAGAHRTAARMITNGDIRPCILVMPSDGLWGDGSGYLPHNGYDFEKWIVEDVIDAVRGNIPQAKASTETYISGLSMGGYGALRLAAAYPEKFAAASGHSSITNLDDLSKFVEEDKIAYLQADDHWGNVISLLLKNRENLPPIRFDCGWKDDLLEANRQLHRLLTEAGVPHLYEEFDGGHEWIYWETHLVDTLRFFLG